MDVEHVHKCLSEECYVHDKWIHSTMEPSYRSLCVYKDKTKSEHDAQGGYDEKMNIQTNIKPKEERGVYVWMHFLSSPCNSS